jgi:hypothetical protein
MKKIFGPLLAAMLWMGPAGLAWGESDSIGFGRVEYWNFSADGEATVEGTSTDIDEGSKVIDGTNHSVIFSAERSFDEWGLGFDLSFGGQSSSKQISPTETADWELETSMFSGYGYWTFLDAEPESVESLTLDALAGLRSYMNYYEIDINPYDPNNNRNRSDQVGWVDPILALRLKSSFNENWGMELYGDCGGFGLGSASELSVLARLALVWSVTEGFGVIGGYRLLNVDSGEESGDERTELDLQMRGFTLGIEAKF